LCGQNVDFYITASGT